MSFQSQQFFRFQEKGQSPGSVAYPGIQNPANFVHWEQQAGNAKSKKKFRLKKRLLATIYYVKSIGSSAMLDDYDTRKLGIFNQLNFFQIIIGICIPVIGLFHNSKFREWDWLVACLPALISITVLVLNAQKKFEAAVVFYFIVYPVMTSIVYMSGVNVGLELFFILYGVLAVFFLQAISHMLFSVALSMISYFVLAVLWKDHRITLESSNMLLYLFNQSAGIVFIFYGLFLIKKENISYHTSILAKNRMIAENAVLLQQQTTELTELNSLKNKLFSVIAHDLKTPMYSMRNMFRNIQQQDMSARQIKSMLPDMVNNLNYTTGLMENLLQWAKWQMHAEGTHIQVVDITKMLEDVIKLLQIQAATKKISLETDLHGALLVKADKDMIALVVRNLLSNAIKFTPEHGCIVIGLSADSQQAQVYVQDNGRGISAEALQKISRNDYYSTNGTAHEPGTGLGLMLCKEFLHKNNSELLIESEPGKGSKFSFLLPSAA